MSEEGLQFYLDGKFTNLESRMTLLEREVHQAHLHQMTAEQAKEIFRTTALRTNNMTRIAVAVIAAIGMTYKKRRSEPASRTATTSGRPARSGPRNQRAGSLSALCSSTSPARKRT